MQLGWIRLPVSRKSLVQRENLFDYLRRDGSSPKLKEGNLQSGSQKFSEN